ncbi:MAG: hypothetical protein ACREJQ_04000, partial [bacterium]
MIWLHHLLRLIGFTFLGFLGGGLIGDILTTIQMTVWEKTRGNMDGQAIFAWIGGCSQGASLGLILGVIWTLVSARRPHLVWKTVKAFLYLAGLLL